MVCWSDIRKKYFLFQAPARFAQILIVCVICSFSQKNFLYFKTQRICLYFTRSHYSLYLKIYLISFERYLQSSDARMDGGHVMDALWGWFMQVGEALFTVSYMCCMQYCL